MAARVDLTLPSFASTAFKMQVAMEALKGEKTMQEIAAEYPIHRDQVKGSKKRALESMQSGFERGGNKTEAQKVEKRVAMLECLVGQRDLELEWLRKKSKELGL